jgi:hypothetical protein
MDIAGFSQDSLDLVQQLLYREGQPNPLEGECGQKAKREAMKGSRTPAQQEADRARAAAGRGQNNVSSAVRSQAAQKAAKTRAQCKGQKSPAPPQPG